MTLFRLSPLAGTIVTAVCVFSICRCWRHTGKSSDSHALLPGTCKLQDSDAPGVRAFHESRLSLEERSRQMVELAESGDPGSIDLLLTLASTEDASGLYLAAINALGSVRSPSVTPRVA